MIVARDCRTCGAGTLTARYQRNSVGPAGLYNSYNLLVVFGQCHGQRLALQGAVVIAVGTTVSRICEQLPGSEQRSQVVDEVRLQGACTGFAARLIQEAVERDYALYAADLTGLLGNFGGFLPVQQAHEKYSSVFGHDFDPAGVKTFGFYLEQG